MKKRIEIKSLSEGFVKLSYVEYAEHLFLLTFHWLHLKSSCKIKKLCEGPFWLFYRKTFSQIIVLKGPNIGNPSLDLNFAKTTLCLV